MARDAVPHTHHDLTDFIEDQGWCWFRAESDHQPGQYHDTAINLDTGETHCTCDGYRFRQTCWHTKEAPKAARYALARRQLAQASDERLTALTTRMLVKLFDEGPLEFFDETRSAFCEALKDVLAARQQEKERRTA